MKLVKNSCAVRILAFLGLNFFILACFPMKPLPRESYIDVHKRQCRPRIQNQNNFSNENSENASVGNYMGGRQEAQNIPENKLQGVQNDQQYTTFQGNLNVDNSINFQEPREIVSENIENNISENDIVNTDNASNIVEDTENKIIDNEDKSKEETNKNVQNTSEEVIEKLRGEAVEDVKEHFDINVSNQLIQSSPKGIFSVRNTNFITVGEKGDIWIWSANLQHKSFVENLGTCVDKVDFDHNTLLLFWSCGAKLYTKELLNENSLKTLDRIKTRASAFSIYKNATEFLVGGADGKLYRWASPLGINITDFDDFERYTAHSTVVSSVAFHPAGRVFFSGDWQGKFKAWLSYKEDEFGGAYDENLFGGRFFEDGSTVKDSGRSGGSIEKIVVNPKGDFVILGFQNSDVEIWKLRSFKKVLGFKASELRLVDIEFVTDNEFVTLSKDNIIKYWQYNEELDDLGEHVYKEKLLGENELDDFPLLLYVSNNKNVLYANKQGNLKIVNFKKSQHE